MCGLLPFLVGILTTNLTVRLQSIIM